MTIFERHTLMTGLQNVEAREQWPPIHGTLRVGLAGAGHASEFHLNAWRRIPEIEVVGICGGGLERATAQANRYSIPAVYRDAAEMVEKASLDVLDILSPRETHAEFVRLGIEAGLHILVQKPLTPTLAEAEQLAAEIPSDMRVMVHENWRFQPRYRLIGDYLAEGRLGKVHQVHLSHRSSNLVPGVDGKRPAVERQPFQGVEPRLLIGEVLIHHLDVIRWLFGPLKVVRAWTGKTQEGIPGDTMATIVLEGPDHLPVIVDGNIATVGFPPMESDRLEILGERASLLLDGPRLLPMGFVAPDREFPFQPDYEEGYFNAIAHFVQCLRNGKPFETPISDNLETLRLVENAYSFAP